MKYIGRILTLAAVSWIIPIWIIANALEYGTSIKEGLKELPRNIIDFIKKGG